MLALVSYSCSVLVQFLFSSCSISRSAILSVFGRSIVRVALSYGYPTVIYLLSYGVYCCLVGGLLMRCKTMFFIALVHLFSWFVWFIYVRDISVSENKALVFQVADGDDQYAVIALIRKVVNTHKHHHKWDRKLALFGKLARFCLGSWLFPLHFVMRGN